jgi:precorrin-6B C5,15-methyltransferase / cobalt-precorrin-6B C5,C15-methyltransferase
MSLAVVLGGTRSGKSRRAEELARAAGRPVRYIATAGANDPEMASRIQMHAARRPGAWEVTAAEGSLRSALVGTDGLCVLIDGIGVWLAGAMHRAGLFEVPLADDRWAAFRSFVSEEVAGVIASSRHASIIVVAEEAGHGIAPIDAASRGWLDVLGEAVARLADAADRVELVVAGRVITLDAPPREADQPELRRRSLVDVHRDVAVHSSTVINDGPHDGRRGAEPRAHRGPDGADAAPRLSIIGIGADGWVGLGDRARSVLQDAEVVIGSSRQLDLLPGEVSAERRSWPSPMDALVDELVAGPSRRTCVLASGDPMLHGIGATLARRLGPEALDVHPYPSAFAFACARLGWPMADVELVSLVARPVDAVARSLYPGRRLVVYVTGPDGAATVAELLRDRGYGPSTVTALERLGAPDERISTSTADGWGDHNVDLLHAVAVECRAAPATTPLPCMPGLPDDAFEHDGQLTKRIVRAATLAQLAPGPGELLWDIGAGSGSIGIEWLRSDPTARAIAIEPDPERAERAARNARRLGVPALDVRCARAPESLAELDPPDAVFIGGGLGEPGVLETCWARLKLRGRLVANAVTLEGETLLQAAHADHGGTLTRVEVSDAGTLGRFRAWRPHLPIVQWAVTKAADG